MYGQAHKHVKGTNMLVKGMRCAERDMQGGFLACSELGVVECIDQDLIIQDVAFGFLHNPNQSISCVLL